MSKLEIHLHHYFVPLGYLFNHLFPPFPVHHVPVGIGECLPCAFFVFVFPRVLVFIRCSSPSPRTVKTIFARPDVIVQLKTVLVAHCKVVIVVSDGLFVFV